MRRREEGERRHDNLVAGSDPQALSVSFSPDGTSLAIAGAGVVQVRDLGSQKYVGAVVDGKVTEYSRVPKG